MICPDNMFAGCVNQTRKQLDAALTMQGDVRRRLKAASITRRTALRLDLLAGTDYVNQRRRALDNAVSQFNDRQVQLGAKTIKTPRTGQII